MPKEETFEYNDDYKTRDRLIFGKDMDYRGKKHGETYSFKDMDATLLKTLIAEKFIRPDETQNNSPMTSEILEMIENVPQVRAHGYVVSPHRRDYRMTLEGIEAIGVSLDDMEYLILACRCADEFRLNLKDGYIRAWWD